MLSHSGIKHVKGATHEGLQPVFSTIKSRVGAIVSGNFLKKILSGVFTEVYVIG